MFAFVQNATVRGGMVLWFLVRAAGATLPNGAGVRGLISFHFSARYRDRVDDLTREVGEDFRGEGFGGSTFRNV
jgi:hypothetical protein